MPAPPRPFTWILLRLRFDPAPIIGIVTALVHGYAVSLDRGLRLRAAGSRGERDPQAFLCTYLNRKPAAIFGCFVCPIFDSWVFLGAVLSH